MPIARFPWTLTALAALVVLLTIGLLWAGAPWQLPTLMLITTAALAGIAVR
jgi:hypothetical protein